MDLRHDRRPFADRAADALHRARADVADGEHARDWRGGETGVRDPAALSGPARELVEHICATAGRQDLRASEL